MKVLSKEDREKINSRQRVYQEKKRSEGKCIQCGEDLVSGSSSHCLTCRDKARISARNRYRVKHGIPIEAPLKQLGRPRKGD